MPASEHTTKILDRLIFFFMVLFLLSLANSIFVNQIGYFGALILILIRYFLTKENQFQKTGLEFAFVWFLLAELLSAIFSGNNPQAYLYLSKRLVMIPLVYTALAAAVNVKRVKQYFVIYIAASLITILIYLYFAYRFYIFNMYSVEQSGPSVFQYPITTGEIISFTVIFLFAFLINEKTVLKYKILLFIGFIVSCIALFSTYKRTGWIGVAAGIFIMLVMKKQWKTLAAVCLVIIALFLTQKNVSKYEIYSFKKNGEVSKTYSYNSKGRAYNVLTVNDTIFLSDFTNGISVFNDSSLVKNIKTPVPIYSINRWKDDTFVADCLDSRFFIVKKNGDNLNFGKEFFTPGRTYSFTLANNILYTLDLDSGLTVYKNPQNLLDTLRYSFLGGCTVVTADSNSLALLKPPYKVIYSPLKSGIPVKFYTYTTSSNIDKIFFVDKKLAISDSRGMNIFSINGDSLNLLASNPNLSHISLLDLSEGRLFAISSNKTLYELQHPLDSKIKILFKKKLDILPVDAVFSKNKLFFASYTQSRLLSIFDLYNESNRTRLALWTAGLKMFRDHPVFGVGDIDLGKLYKKYKHKYNKEIEGHLHNNYFHELAILGLFGFLAFCFLMIKIYLIDLKIFRKTKGIPFISSYALGVLGAFTAFLVSGLTEYNFGDQEIITLVYFTLGLNLALFFILNRKKESNPHLMDTGGKN